MATTDHADVAYSGPGGVSPATDDAPVRGELLGAEPSGILGWVLTGRTSCSGWFEVGVCADRCTGGSC